MNNNRTQISIDDDALLHNVRRIKDFAKQSPVIAMIKANAYGHGMEHVGQVLQSEVNILGVACSEEAQRLRMLMPEKAILIAGGVFSENEWPEIFSGGFEVVIHSFWQVESLLAFCVKTNFQPPPINIWIKIDTGMRRLGFIRGEALKAYEKLSQCPYINKPIGWMTHFACADEPQNPMTQNQIAQFESILAQLPATFSEKRSLANSAGIIAWPDSRQGYVRPGILLYGISPFKNQTGEELGLKPVMRFQSHIMAIKMCDTGDTVGYGAIWHADKPSRIAIVAAGYGDGYPRHISPDAKVWIKGAYCPIVGRVSMDMLAINISEVNTIFVGDSVELWGSNLPVEVVASFANTSPYELVTQVRSRGDREK